MLAKNLCHEAGFWLGRLASEVQPFASHSHDTFAHATMSLDLVSLPVLGSVRNWSSPSQVPQYKVSDLIVCVRDKQAEVCTMRAFEKGELLFLPLSNEFKDSLQRALFSAHLEH